MNYMSQEIGMLELLMTKMCHDLSAPIGAVYNGIEFLDEEEIPALKDNPAYELMALNIDIAVKRLRFFRYIYGKSDYKGEVDIDALEEVLIQFFDKTKINLIFSPYSKQVALTFQYARLFAVFCYISSFYLVYGGVIDAKIEKGDINNKIVVSASSEKEINKIWDIEAIMLDEELKELRLNNAIVYLASIICRQLLIKPQIKITNHSIVIECDLRTSLHTIVF